MNPDGTNMRRVLNPLDWILFLWRLDQLSGLYLSIDAEDTMDHIGHSADLSDSIHPSNDVRRRHPGEKTAIGMPS